MNYNHNHNHDDAGVEPKPEEKPPAAPFMSLQNISVPIVTLMSIISFFGWLTYTAATERYRLGEEIHVAIAEVKKEISDLDQRGTVGSLESRSRTEKELNEKMAKVQEDIRRLDQIDHDIVDKNVADLKDQIKDAEDHYNMTNKQHDALIDKMKDLLLAIRERQVYVLENIWTKSNHNTWCHEAEALNPNWKCPSYQTLLNNGLIGSEEQHGINNSIDQEIQRFKDAPNQLWAPGEYHNKAPSKK